MTGAGIARIMLLAFALSSALPFVTTKATSAQTVALSADQASERWICRQSDDLAASDATMNDAGRTRLICRPLRIEARLSDNTMMRIGSTRSKAIAGPALSNALSPDQINDAWVRFVMKQLNEMPFTGGG